MRILPCVMMVIALVSMNAAAARAAWSPPSLGRWMGLGKDKATGDGETVRTAGGSSKMPAMVTKMTGGTKRLVTNTANKLSPKKTTTRKSGTTGLVRAKDPREEKPGFFQSLFHPEPPPPPKTIKEWMSLKQIHP